MKKIQFVSITTSSVVEEGKAYIALYGKEDILLPSRLKGDICVIFVDKYGFPYIENVTKWMRKYTCGQIITRKMAQNFNNSLREMEFFLDEKSGIIPNLEQSLKKAGKDNGYI